MSKENGGHEIKSDRDNTPVARISLRRVKTAKAKKKKSSGALNTLRGLGAIVTGSRGDNTPSDSDAGLGAGTPPVSELPSIAVNIPARPVQERKPDYGPALRLPSGEFKPLNPVALEERRKHAAGRGVARRDSPSALGLEAIRSKPRYLLIGAGVALVAIVIGLLFVIF